MNKTIIIVTIEGPDGSDPEALRQMVSDAIGTEKRWDEGDWNYWTRVDVVPVPKADEYIVCYTFRGTEYTEYPGYQTLKAAKGAFLDGSLEINYHPEYDTASVVKVRGDASRVTVYTFSEDDVVIDEDEVI